MSKNPFFSVIVPCYNQAQYLEEAVNSVIAQTFTNWECIIINDGSPDNTEEIALSLCETDHRIKYFYKKNGGVADTRNYGIDKASGEWILPLDGDDKISNKYLERTSQIINTNPEISLIYSNTEFFGEKQGVWILPVFSYKELLTANMICNSAIFNKQNFLQIGGYDLNMVYGYEDWELWINLLKDTNQQAVYKLNSVEFFYRYKDTSRDRDLIKEEDRVFEMKNYIFIKHKHVYNKYFGSIQDNFYQNLLFKDKIKGLSTYHTNVKRNILTKGLYRLIRLLNKF